MRRLLALAVIVGASAALVAVEAACSSFGSAEDPASSVDASSDAAPASDGGSSEGALPPGAKFCDGKSYAVCSDFEPPVLAGKGATTAGGWTSVDTGSDLVVEVTPAVPAGSRGQGLHVKVPVLADGVTAAQAMRSEMRVPSELTFAATMQMGVNSVTQYTELLSIDLTDDPTGLQVVLQMLDGKLVLSEIATVNGTRPEVALLAIGDLTALKPLRVEVHLWFADGKNEIAIKADNGTMLPRQTLKTAAAGKPAGKLTFSAGYSYSLGSNGRSGGGYYLDDVTLQTTP